MASVFTYETDPIQVASPWPKEPLQAQNGTARAKQSALEFPGAIPLSEYGITKLVAEPQEGPVEYKLHLLLRPRRNFAATSTMQKISGSHLSKGHMPSSYSAEPASRSVTPTLAPSTVSRQKRLRHLTTQLLWRLQQSCPHHTSSKSELVVPVLPEAELQASASKGPGEVATGLEETLGALYEIGVSDDGSLIGLARDELDESLTVLGAMAHSLGCELQVLRLVDVGECQWIEDVQIDSQSSTQIRKDRLHVAEVWVGPGVALPSNVASATATQTTLPHLGSIDGCSSGDQPDMKQSQLRVSLTGSTTCGKTSLLGTLSTSTLDNGRGSSRLSLLKHRHEIVSGVTSSLAQELIGYHHHPPCDDDGNPDIVNYASDNVSSWNDIHSAAQPGRLVFVTDSAGHPRYRRTTVRGLISWAPHWTLCCIAADDGEDVVGRAGGTASAAEILGHSGEGVDLSKAHLGLCLRLELPMVVIITKYDLASRDRLRQTMAKILSTLKDAGRKPVLLPITPLKGYCSLSQSISREDKEAVSKVLSSTSSDHLHLLVPIICSSALNGTGISKVHELLRQLPNLPLMTPAPEKQFGSHEPLFHIDEVITTAHRGGEIPASGSTTSSDYILSGYLRHGSLGVGENVLVGPCAGQSSLEIPESAADHLFGSQPESKEGSFQTSNGSSLSYPAPSRHRSGVHLHPRPSQGTMDVWSTRLITSIRYLRLPVRRLHSGQVATIAITTPEPAPSLSNATSPLPLSAPRKGMVLLRPAANPADPSLPPPPPAYSTFTAVFKEPNTYVIPGSSVTVYIASIRALAKIIEVRVPDSNSAKGGHCRNRDGGGVQVFTFEDDDDHQKEDAEEDGEEDEARLEAIEITFLFASSREWIEIGTRVLVTPASGLSMLNPPPAAAAAAPLSSSERGNGGGESGIGYGSGGGSQAGLDGFVGLIVGAA